MSEKQIEKISRKTALKTIVLGAVGALAASAYKNEDETFWQIDPTKCIQCGRCETDCVLPVSAVKCVHQFESCGYCDFCSGYYREGRLKLDTAAENLLCPVDAIKRKYIEEPYFEYTIDEELCIACGKCVKGCSAYGNGSLVLQVRRDLCLNCNECAINRVCPTNAFVKVSGKNPYIIKKPVFDV